MTSNCGRVVDSCSSRADTRARHGRASCDGTSSDQVRHVRSAVLARGALCTFRVLCKRFERGALGLRSIVQIAGATVLHRHGDMRVARGAPLLEEMFACLARNQG
jgi:hypothetical protein